MGHGVQPHQGHPKQERERGLLGVIMKMGIEAPGRNEDGYGYSDKEFHLETLQYF